MLSTKPRNSCPRCGSELQGKRKTCSNACRVALSRQRKRGDSSDAPLVAITRRALAPSLRAKQLEARRKLKIEHAKRRREMRDIYRAETTAMKLELQVSDARIAAEHDAEIQTAAQKKTLSELIAAVDWQALSPQEKDERRRGQV